MPSHTDPIADFRENWLPQESPFLPETQLFHLLSGQWEPTQFIPTVSGLHIQHVMIPKKGYRMGGCP